MQNENASWSGCVWNWQHRPGNGTLAESRRLLHWSALGEDWRGGQTAGRGNEHLLLHESDWRCLAAPGRGFGLHKYPSTTNSANCCEGSRYLFIFGVGPKIHSSLADWNLKLLPQHNSGCTNVQMQCWRFCVELVVPSAREVTSNFL